MYTSDPFYSRIMARLSNKPLDKEVKSKLKLAAIDDVENSWSILKDTLEIINVTKIDEFNGRLRDFRDKYAELQRVANELLFEFEELDNKQSYMSGTISDAENASLKYMDLANELGIDPITNDFWSELQDYIESAKEVEQMFVAEDIDELLHINS